MNGLIIYEDDNLIVVNKPANLLTHHSHYARNITEESLLQLLRKTFPIKLHPIHRLDRKTSGVLMVAKDVATAVYYQNQFTDQSITKEYNALVRGFVPDELTIDSPVKNDRGNYQEALTLLKCLQQTEVEMEVEPYPTARYSLVSLIPKTGRTHQLRKHMNKIAHPIIGDSKYGNRHHNHAFEAKFGHSRLYLHAKSITFEHPTKGTFTAMADFPEFWERDLEVLGISL
ncbi:pseudouridine synthase [Paracrocinitomix mangrovi]|uniref:RluA family pseudouridine synthase n=1 Tax=Paracrocinitomix mangrovi TaxID=2862509 RepID=UPI001C8D16E8|nr:pseudouridine synthase [Paracrocinitomix mangrovi]UKN02308.1 pseudouridine synthase [Paracrocinitomix mangrovi]